ncbi:hypothetical protein SFRURICE_006387 [Spodoptera frugiperda]|nr:hypothetical protein SFRURICE_006387 [Spodoptera frugiperda]
MRISGRSCMSFYTKQTKIRCVRCCEAQLEEWLSDRLLCNVSRVRFPRQPKSDNDIFRPVVRKFGGVSPSCLGKHVKRLLREQRVQLCTYAL